MESKTLRTLHELQLLQLELKAQNEELQQLRELAELESVKYLELFHSSPTGYFTLSRDGSILDINMTGANILGKDQAKLKNNRFGFFVSVDSRAIFNYFIKRIFISHEKETCEVTLIIHGKFPFVVSLSGIAKTKGEHCFVTIINLSELDNASKLSVANQEKLSQNDEATMHALDLLIARKEFTYQNDESSKLSAELALANQLLTLENEQLVSLGSAPTMILDSQWCIMRFNKTFQALTGYEESQLFGQKIDKILSPGQEKLLLNQFKNALSDRNNENIEIQILHSDASILTLIVNSWTIYDSDGHTPISHFLQGRDITKSKNLESELAKISEFNQSILRTIPFPIDIVDVTGTVLFQNDNFKEIFGESAIGKKCWNLDRDDKEQCRDCPLTNNVTIGLTASCEYHGVLGNRIFEIDYTGMIYQGKRALLEIFRDITERKQGEFELIQAKKQVEEKAAVINSIVQSTSDWIWEVNEQGIYTYCSEKVEQILGYTAEEMFGKSPVSFMSEEESKRVSLIFQNIMKAREPIFDLENWNIHKDGHLVCLLTNGVPKFDETGKLIGYIGADKDITRRKHDEQTRARQLALINSLLDSIPDMIFFKDTEGVYLGCNPSFSTFVGKSRNDIIGKTDYDLFEKAIADSFRQYDREMLRQKLPRHNEEWVTYPDGRKILIDTLKTPYWSGDRSLIGVIGISRDITDRKKKETDLSESEQRYQALVEWSPYAVLVHRDMKILYVNKAAVKLFGATSEEELVGTPVMRWHHPDYHQIVQERISKAREEGIPAGLIESKYFKVDGTVMDLEAQGMPIIFNGLPSILATFNDVTERNHIDAIKKQTEARYISMISNISDVIGIMGADGLMKYKSANIEKFFGWLPEDRVGTSGFSTVHPDDIPNVQNIFDSLLGEENSEETLEFRYLCKDGSYKPIELTASNQLNNPAINGVLLNYRDISIRKTKENVLLKSELKYKESEDKLSLLMNSAGEGIYGIDLKGDCTYANRSCIASLGYKTEKDFLGKNIHDLIHHSYSDNRPLKAEDCEIFLAFHKGKGTHTDDEVFWRADGSSFPVEYYSHPIFINEKVAGAVVTFNDISERKKAEEESKLSSTRLALATQSGGVGVWEYDVVNGVLLWDKQMYALYGILESDFSSAYEARLAGLHPEDVERSDAEIQMALIGEKEFDNEFRVIWPDRSVHIIRAFANVHHDHAGKPLRMIGTNWDVTRQKQNEEILLKARQEAESANKAKSQFLANMSHEIRTPLNAIIGFSQLMNRQDLTELQMEYSNSIHRSGEHLLILLNDILELSKIEAGQVKLNQTHIDVYALFGDLHLMFNQLAQSKQIELIFERDDEFPHYIFADETKIRQILINLIGNAIKFTEAGSVVVRVRVIQTAEQKNDLVVEVQDSGQGIPKSDFERIFKHFEQTEAGIKQGVGTGLGLALSRELATLMGGSITVMSKIGKGSLFTFVVELKEGKLEFAEEKINKRVIGMINPPHAYRILVADDKKENLAVLVGLLRLVGFETCEAVNGKDAIAKFEQCNPHLILMDMRMPVMNGAEAIRQIRASEKGKMIPIIVQTASQLEDDKAKTIAMGIQGYIRKPFREDELFGVIGKILGITYSYQEDKEADPLSKYLNDPEALVEDVAKLPANILAQLREALEEANFYLLIEHTRQIDATNPKLAQYLRALANNFELKSLLKILKK